MRAREVLLEAAKFRVARLRFSEPDGREIIRDVVEHPGAAVVVPVLDDGRVVLIRNMRRTVGETLWEIPAGTLEPNEPPEHCAARELEEETGYRAANIAPLTEFYASPGVLNERMHGFVGTGLTRTSQALDQDEHIEVFPTPSWQVREMLLKGEIQDGKSIALLLYWMYLHHAD